MFLLVRMWYFPLPNSTVKRSAECYEHRDRVLVKSLACAKCPRVYRMFREIKMIDGKRRRKWTAGVLQQTRNTRSSRRYNITYIFYLYAIAFRVDFTMYTMYACIRRECLTWNLSDSTGARVRNGSYLGTFLEKFKKKNVLQRSHWKF